MARRRRNPWTSTGEVVMWLLFVALLFPAGFAGYAVGHYTSLGKGPTRVTVTVGSTSTPTTSAGTTTSSGGSALADGKTVFASSGCGSCHTFTPAGSSGSIGPNLDTAPAKDAKADGNMDLAAFVKQSITDPKAYLAQGYTTTVMPTNFGTSLSATQLSDLVAFILSGTQK